MTSPFAIEAIDDFAPFGITAFTTRREAGTFGTAGSEPVSEVMHRWDALRAYLRSLGAGRLATAHQVHGDRVLVHDAGWEGWLRSSAADGHVSLAEGTGMAVTIADCVPVFIAHPSGAAGAIHSGWRGTAARIVERGIDALARRGLPAAELRIHLGPAICGKCYEVSADVFIQLTGRDPGKPTAVDLRTLIAAQARAAGVRHLSISDRCTRCDNADFFSHRAGDSGRQLGVIATPLS